MTTIGHAELQVAGLCMGTEVFGWTADEPTSFALRAARGRRVLGVLDEVAAGHGVPVAASAPA